MTNADKYLKDGVKNEFIKEVNSEMDLYGGQFNVEKFLSYEIKPTLTEDEKVILRNLPKDADSIGRDSDGELEIKMINQNNCNDFGYDWFGWYDKLFQFIQPRRRI